MEYVGRPSGSSEVTSVIENNLFNIKTVNHPRTLVHVQFQGVQY